jgi:dTDP-4-dehydrorhamnose reductase
VALDSRRHRVRHPAEGTVSAVVVIVTGASGYLGREVVRLALAAGNDVVGVARTRRVGGAAAWAAVDVRDAAALRELAERVEPVAVVHTAYVRQGPDAASTTVDGSATVAAVAAGCGARLVHVSTDLVFGGRAEHYSEADPPAPVDDYGRWKAAAEKEVVRACPGAVVVRPSLLYGDEHLSPIQQAVLDAVDGRVPMSFYTDEVRCPSHVVDVAAALVALCRRCEISGPLHLGGPEALSRYELACLIARWAGRSPDLVRPGRAAEHGSVRPGHVVLDSRRAVRLGLKVRSPLAALARD